MLCDANILRHDSDSSSKGATSGMGQTEKSGWAPGEVGFAFKNGQRQTGSVGPFRANSGSKYLLHAAAIYSMISSARASSDGSTVSPSAFAVLRLMIRSNFVGCSTGRSPGFAPFRILSTYSAARRNRFALFGP
jgi:hypothetical protein